MIVRLPDGSYRLYSLKKVRGKRRNLGTFPTRAGAEKHERQVEAFKRDNLHAIPLDDSPAERARLRRALVKRSKTRAELSRAARRAHGAQEPSAAKNRYRRALVAFIAETWTMILRAVAPSVRTDDLAGDKALYDRVRLRLFDHVKKEAPAVIDKAGGEVAADNTKEMKRLIGFDPRIDPGLKLAMDRFREENVRLITSVVEEQIDRVKKTIDANYGLRVEDLAKKLKDEFDVTQSRAELIARDQVLKLNGQLTSVRQQNAGIEEYVWTTSGDERVRGDPAGKYPDAAPSHYARDGQRFRWDTPPDGGHPGEDFQCRCTAYPVIPALEEAE